MADMNPLPQQLTIGGYYQHFKGNYYRVLHCARHSETQEHYVVYQALYGERGLWVRPLAMFLETIQRDGQTMPRFSPCQPPMGEG